MKQFISFTLLSTIIVIIPFFVGCESRYNLEKLEGNVTFAGEMLKCGSIVFIATNNNGIESVAPPTAAGIKDGKFLIPKQYGLQQGKYRVIIKGLEGIPRGDLPLGREIFPAYDVLFEYTGQTTVDFAVPALKKPISKSDENKADPSVFISQ